MSLVRPKSSPLRLGPDQYNSLRSQVLRRDGWRCQFCGAMSNLEVHHKDFRSHSGDDSEENLITLCNVCHATVHCN
jgi:5-methylcytosine-specific restriction endonuclease McrA